MADPRFYDVHGPFTLSQLAEISGAEIGGDTNPDASFTDVAPLDAAESNHVSFLDNKMYAESFAKSRAGACLVEPAMTSVAPDGMALLITNEPYHGYAKVSRAFYPEEAGRAGVAPTASVDEKATLGDGCVVEAGAVIGAGAELGHRCRVGPNAVIGPGVVLGDDCVIGPCASLRYCIVGARVIVHDGVRIGQDGFGFAMGTDSHLKVPQVGRVVVEDDVEIGANTTIDRGAAPDTVIGAGTKIDNLVQIGHNVQLGRGCIIVSQVGISGSTKAGDYVMMGGQAGLTGHLRIGAGARIAAQSGVLRDVEPGATIAGTPAIPNRAHWRQIATLARLARKTGKD